MLSFHSLLVHIVFSTKEREPIPTREVRARRWPYLEEHHRVRGFRKELESFLVRHGLEFEHSMLD
jgi:hypothetical protein